MIILRYRNVISMSFYSNLLNVVFQRVIKQNIKVTGQKLIQNLFEARCQLIRPGSKQHCWLLEFHRKILTYSHLPFCSVSCKLFDQFAMEFILSLNVVSQYRLILLYTTDVCDGDK